MNSDLIDRIVAILVPEFRTENERRAIIGTVFYGISKLENQSWGGDAEIFSRLLIRKLIDYGRLTNGTTALEALLIYIRKKVGVDKQEEIDAILAELKAGTEPNPPTSTVSNPKQDEKAKEPSPPSIATLEPSEPETETGLKIFVSYSRDDDKDNKVSQKIIPALEQGGIVVWFDKQDLPFGTPDWEKAIREAIESVDLLLLLASPSSRESAYVRDEIAIAKAKNKAINAAWIAGQEWSDSIPLGLGHTQMMDLRGDKLDKKLNDLVFSLINPAAKTKPPTSPKVPPKNTPPVIGTVPAHPAKARPLPVQATPSWRDVAIKATLVVALIGAIATVSAAIISSIWGPITVSNHQATQNANASASVIAMQRTDEAATQSIIDSTETQNAINTANALALQSANETATQEEITKQAQIAEGMAQTQAVNETATHIANQTATRQESDNQTRVAEDVDKTQAANELATQQAIETQIALNTQDAVETANALGTQSANETATSEAAMTATIERAMSSTPASNTAWTPITQQFGNHEMVFVPAGRFTMGSELFGNLREGVDIPKPFWIDRYEVSEQQYSNMVSDSLLPQTNITQTEAQDYCKSIGGDLPTEEQWEYAARGVDSWNYSWGNDWDSNLVNGRKEDGSNSMADVESFEDGASWVGAVNMIGNVAEWTDTMEDGNFIYRGGTFEQGEIELYAYKRPNVGGDRGFNIIGFRCVINIEG